MSKADRVEALNLIEELQDGGGLPHVTVERSCVEDWQRILMDAHSDLTRQLCYYTQDGNEKRVAACLRKIEFIAKAWREKGPKE